MVIRDISITWGMDTTTRPWAPPQMSWIHVSERMTQVSGFNEPSRWWFYNNIEIGGGQTQQEADMPLVCARRQGQGLELLGWKVSCPPGEGKEKGYWQNLRRHPGSSATGWSPGEPQGALYRPSCSSFKPKYQTLWALYLLPTNSQCSPIWEHCQGYICSKAYLPSCHQSQLSRQRLPSA